MEIAPLDFSRTHIEEYWGENTDQEIKTKWKNISFDDTLMSNACFNYCCYLVGLFQPMYLNYSVEANNKAWSEAELDKFLIFLSRVYPRLKQNYPLLPVFVSYIASVDSKQLENAKKLNPYSDYVALSTYPYMELGSNVYGSTEQVIIPGNWYSKYREIDTTKPFAIAKTGIFMYTFSPRVFILLKLIWVSFWGGRQ